MRGGRRSRWKLDIRTRHVRLGFRALLCPGPWGHCGEGVPVINRCICKSLGSYKVLTPLSPAAVLSPPIRYAHAGEADPKVLLTTSRDPSSRLVQFAKVWAGGECEGRGHVQ